MVSVDLPLNTGDVVASTLEIEQLLGTGAVGAVFAAIDLVTGRQVALKCMLPKHAERTSLIRRFAREARVAARFTSGHMVRILRHGTLGRVKRAVPRPEDPRTPALPYIVMERLDGIDLSALLARRGPLCPHAAAGYVAQACVALAEAHALGLVHRDIKPGNLFLTRSVGEEVIKLLDFGIAKFHNPNAAGDSHRLTDQYTALGTPPYMPPEQIADAGNVDARADIWSLGVTLFRLITGATPFLGETTTDLWLSIIREPPLHLEELQDDIPPGLDAVVQRCLRKPREERYRSVTELHQALALFARPCARTAGVAALATPWGPPVEETLPERRPRGHGSHAVETVVALETL